MTRLYLWGFFLMVIGFWTFLFQGEFLLMGASAVMGYIFWPVVKSWIEEVD